MSVGNALEDFFFKKKWFQIFYTGSKRILILNKNVHIKEI